jgi:defect-in-organelle-trafficking protein DotC
MIVKRILCLATVLSILSVSAPVFAENGIDSVPPPERIELENISYSSTSDKDGGMPFDIRGQALKEAALSYGARGGLAWRTYQLRQELDARKTYLDKTFDFRQLLIPAPSGLLIEPPIISESVNAVIIDCCGQEAAVADRVYNIGMEAKIVAASRVWQNYMERAWGDVTPPPDLLRPRDEVERQKWVAWVREGWDKGVEQADSIFEDDLNRMSADYQGMVRYRMLLAQGMVSPPLAMQIDRGVTGGGKEMRVGDRAIQITGQSELQTEAQSWQPVSR